VTIRVDADVLAWLKRQGRGYQTRINKLLREAMEGKQRPRRVRKIVEEKPKTLTPREECPTFAKPKPQR
jgi:uncharacterized protein (UPF0147 family)